VAERFDSSELPSEKQARYAVLVEEICAVLDGEPNLTARMATVAAMLADSFADFLWTGFYVVDPDPDREGELVIGPYQGRLGCLRIRFGQGVCGAAVTQKRTIVVPDVDAFPGHIVCDIRSRSEIVAPVFGRGGALIGVLDIDSAKPAAFDEIDARALEDLLRRAFADAQAS
jgi:L-methionine (R)-S-oxide reductase